MILIADDRLFSHRSIGIAGTSVVHVVRLIMRIHCCYVVVDVVYNRWKKRLWFRWPFNPNVMWCIGRLDADYEVFDDPDFMIGLDRHWMFSQHVDVRAMILPCL